MPVEDITTPDYPPRTQQSFGSMPVFQSLRRHFVLVLLPAVLLVAGAVAIGLERTPEYESEARLNVGGLTLTQQSLEGYTTAVQTLAVAYARAIDAEGVVRPASEATGVPPGEVVSRISATPIPGSAVIRVIAKGEDGGQTVRLADAAAEALVDYAVELNSGETQGAAILKRFVAASRAFRRDALTLDRARRRNRDTRALETRVDLARLKMQVAGVIYQNSQSGQATTGLVQKLAPASRASSDRDEMLRTLVAAAAVGGLLIGIGLAVWRGNSLARRRLGHR